MITDKNKTIDTVRKAVSQATITDIHTHLFPPSHGDLLLWGVDELLTYHYLVAELFTIAPPELSYDRFWAMSKSEQADQVWKYLFIESSPISESRRGVLTVLTKLGLDPADRDLNRLRQWFASQNVDSYLEKVFELAGLDYAIMTNNPLLPEETAHFDATPATPAKPVPSRLKTALRVDDLILKFPQACEEIARQGISGLNGDLSGDTAAKVIDWLNSWADRIDPVYLAASMSFDWRYPADDMATRVIDEIIVPFAAGRSLPVAMMIGVHRQINPQLHEAGDAVAPCDVQSIIRLCDSNPEIKFLITTLSRADQHALTVAARKYRNLHLFGCWWFCNNPSIIDEMTRQRLELLGTNVTLQHSDARVLDQLIYKWTHSRAIIADVLADKYSEAFDAGWRFSADEIERDVRCVFGGAFERFIAK